jgi:hypothetical protein
MRIAAVEARGQNSLAVARVGADQRIVESCEKAMSKREEAIEKRLQHRAQEEAARQAKADRQAAKQAESAAKTQRKAEEKKQHAQRKAEQKAAKAREKERRRYMGGMSWGYDPNAGVATCLPADIQSSRSRYQPYNRDSDSRRTSGTAGSSDSGPKYYDRVTGKYYRRSEFDNALGVEIGGPNRTQPPGPLCDRSPVADTSHFRHRDSSRDTGPDDGPLFNVKVKGRAEG